MPTAISEREVELIVAEVMRRLGEFANGTNGVADKPDSGAVDASSPNTKPAAEALVQRPVAVNRTEDEDTLRLTDRVVTLASLDGRLVGKRRVLVEPRAVVTPAVRDELRRVGVTLERMQAGRAKQATLLLLNAAVEVDVRGIAAALAERDEPVDVRMERDLEAAVRKLDADGKSPNPLGSGQLGAIITRQPELALILANRHKRLRAIQGHSRQRLPESLKSTAANVLVIDPTGRGEQEMVEWLLEFKKIGRKA